MPEQPTHLLPSVPDQVTRFSRQREADRAAIAEDYVELIADLLQERGEARAVDVAHRMGVTQSTVAATVARLQRVGLIDTKPYRSLFLTSRGLAMADAIRHRHDVVLRLLLAVGLDAEAAETDAAGMQHHVSEQALAAFARFLAERDLR